MIYQSISNTGIEVSLIGLGTVKLGRNEKVHYPSAFDLPTDTQVEGLLDCAKHLGINLIDTAPAYGSSEERLGKLLSDRQHWIISTKVGETFHHGESHYDFSAKATRLSVEQSLKRLRTDYLDIVLVHSNGDDLDIIQNTPVFETLATLKTEGHLRAFGMSSKTVEGGKCAVDQSDLVMVTYHPGYREEKPVIAYAHQKNKGVFIKKALASGHLNKISGDNPVQFTMDFILKQPGISSIVIGTLNPTHLEYNVLCAERET